VVVEVVQALAQVVVLEDFVLQLLQQVEVAH
jgi:hypothetical protein